MQRDKLELLLEKTQTVFDIEDLASVWDYLDYKKVKELAKKEAKVLGQKIIYYQLKPEILFNPLGIEKKDNYNLASKERAISDSLYISPALAFDNLKNIDPKRLLEISKIYENKRLEREIQNRLTKNLITIILIINRIIKFR